MKSLQWETVCFNVKSNRNTEFHFQMESWLASPHFLHSRRKTLTQDVVVLQFIWSNFQLLRNQTLMFILTNLYYLQWRRKQSRVFWCVWVFFFFFLENDSYANCHVLGRVKGINNGRLLLVILDLQMFEIKPVLEHKAVILYNATWSFKTFIQFLGTWQAQYQYYFRHWGCSDE